MMPYRCLHRALADLGRTMQQQKETNLHYFKPLKTLGLPLLKLNLTHPD